MVEKECKLLSYSSPVNLHVQVGVAGKCAVYEYPEIEKELNIYLNHGWKITPISIGEFYLEREKR